jgi:hypothetical protein
MRIISLKVYGNNPRKLLNMIRENNEIHMQVLLVSTKGFATSMLD